MNDQPGYLRSALSWVRRRFVPYPNRITPDQEAAWLREEIRSTAIPQPYSSPLTTGDGGLSGGETYEMRRAYREMVLREPAVKSAILTKALAVASLDLQVLPANKRLTDDKAAARFLDHAITTSDGGLPGLVMGMVTPSLVDGWSVVEPVFDYVDPHANQYANYWTLKRAKGKDTDGLRLRLDEFRNILGVQAVTAGQGGASFSPDDFLIFSHLSFFCNPFGISDLRAAYRAANLIEAAIKLRAILLENFSGPYLVGKAKDPGAMAAMKTILANARARGYIVIPDGAEVQVINLATSSPDQFQQTIRDLREEIVMAVQGSYLQLLEGGVSNGRGNTQTHASIAELFQWWLAADIANTINHRLAPLIIRPNFGRGVGLPRVKLGGIDPQAITQSLARFLSLQQLGLPLSRDQVYEEGYAEPPRDSSDEIKPPQAAQAPNPFGMNDGGVKGGGNVAAFADTFPLAEAARLIGQEAMGYHRSKAG